MGLIDGDGFDLILVTDLTDHAQSYDTVNTLIKVGEGRCGSNCLFNDAAGGNGPIYGVTTSDAAGYAGFWYKPDSMNIARVCFWVGNAGGDVLGFLYLEVDGSLEFWKGPNTVLGTKLGGTAAGLLAVDRGDHVGVEWKFHASTGYGRIYVNKDAGGTADYASGNTNTENIWTFGQWRTISLRPHGRMDDAYWGDTTGAVNTAFLGNLRVQEQVCLTDAVGGAGTHQDFTPSTGTDHGALVDDATPDDNSTYLVSSTVGHQETVRFADITLGSGTVYGLQVLINAVNDNTGSRSLAPLVRSGVTTAVGTTQSVADTTYASYWQMYELNPVTSVAWSAATVNAAQLGVKVAA